MAPWQSKAPREEVACAKKAYMPIQTRTVLCAVPLRAVWLTVEGEVVPSADLKVSIPSYKSTETEDEIFTMISRRKIPISF